MKAVLAALILLRATPAEGQVLPPGGDRRVIAAREFVIRVESKENPVTHALWVSRDGGKSWLATREAGVTESWGPWIQGVLRCTTRVPESGSYDFFAQLGDALSNRSPEPRDGQAADPKLRLSVKTAHLAGLESTEETGAITVRTGQPANVVQARALYDRARVLHSQQRLDEARMKYQEALTAWPDFDQAHNALGKLHAEQREPAKALECFLRARKSCPSDPISFVNAARMELELGLLDDALADLRDATALGLEGDEQTSLLAGETLWVIARTATLARHPERARAACEILLKIRQAPRATRAKARQMMDWLK
jgi:hypothetical protein